MENKYGLITAHLERNSGVAYASPAKITNKKEKEVYQAIFEEAKQAVSLFNEILLLSAKEYGLVDFRNRNFLDGSNRKVRSYFWGKLKYVTMMNDPESISLFCEYDSKKKKARFRISLEIDERNASIEAMQNHFKLLDKPIKDKSIVYLVNDTSAKDLTEKGTDAKKIKEEIKKGLYKKVQPSVLIEDFKSDKELLEKVKKAIGLLLPYYDYVMGI